MLPSNMLPLNLILLIDVTFSTPTWVLKNSMFEATLCGAWGGAEWFLSSFLGRENG